MDNGCPAQEVSEGNNISNWPPECSDNILAKNVAIFCFCSKNLLEAKLKCFGLMSLAEESSRQPSIDCVCGYYRSCAGLLFKKQGKQERHTKELCEI